MTRVRQLLTVLGPREKDALTWLLVGLWCVHYVNRTLIFPFRLNTQGKRMPLAIVFSAIGFNAVNGGLNGWWLGFAAPPDRPVPDALSLMGTGLFVAGMLINHWADTKLIGLRARGTGYVVPRGGLFERISCPNHFGEIASNSDQSSTSCECPCAPWASCPTASAMPSVVLWIANAMMSAVANSLNRCVDSSSKCLAAQAGQTLCPYLLLQKNTRSP